MGQESLVYSFVARGTIVLAEFSTELTDNFSAIAIQCLGKIPSTNNKFTYTFDHHTYNFLVHDGYVYCIVAKEIVSKQISLMFLDRLRDDFKRRYGGGKADTLVAKSLNKEFGPVMKEQMQYIIDHAEEIDKVSKVKAQVSQVKTEMEANIIKVLDRGQGLDALSNKAESLRDAAQEFKRGGDQIRRKMWFQNMKIKLIVLGVLLVLALILWLSICHGFSCSN